MKKVFYAIIIALGIVCSDTIYFEYECNADERWPRFLGFPFVQSTDTTWVFSMSGELFLFGFLGNIIVWAALLVVIFYFLTKLKFKRSKIIGTILLSIVLVISMFIFIVYFSVVDWRLKWHHDNFKLNYYQKNLECKKTLNIFK